MSVPRVEEPLGHATPYIIPAYEGEALRIPGSKSTIRILASAKESDGLISVLHLDGVAGYEPGFHYHNKAHDIFMCVKGKIKVWAGDKCRLLGPGDFCSVPPKVIHQPQLVDPFNETIGLVTPGHWVDVFRFISEKYDGILTDEFDCRNMREMEQALFPNFAVDMKEKYDIIVQPQHKGCEVSEWTGKDSQIPTGIEAYYLRANTGPRYLLGGVLSRPFITTKQSDGKFAITSIESSSKYPVSVLNRPFMFHKVHQVYYLLDGSICVTVDDKPNDVRSGDTIFIPAGTKTSIKFTAKFVRFWSFASGDGLETLISQGGGQFEGTVVPDKARKVDPRLVLEAAKSIGLEVAT